MAFSRRPARFERRHSMQNKANISEDKLEVLRAAAARVYINEQNPAEKSTEVNKPVVGDVKEEAGLRNGIQLLAAAADEITTAKKK